MVCVTKLCVKDGARVKVVCERERVTKLEQGPLVVLARVPVCPWIGVVPVCPCARVPVDRVVPGCPCARASDRSRSPEVTRLQAVAVCLLIPQTVCPH